MAEACAHRRAETWLTLVSNSNIHGLELAGVEGGCHKARVRRAGSWEVVTDAASVHVEPPRGMRAECEAIEVGPFRDAVLGRLGSGGMDAMDSKPRGSR
jgi:hypothetical protein